MKVHLASWFQKKRAASEKLRPNLTVRSRGLFFAETWFEKALTITM